MLRDEILDIKNKKSFMPFENIVEGLESRNYQAVELLCWLFSKKGLFTFDTGLGKTMAIISAMKALKNTKPKARFLIVVKKAQIVQMLTEIKSLTDFTTIWTNASVKRIKERLYTRSAKDVDIVIITHETLSLLEMQEFLIASANNYLALFIDEMHLVANYGESDRAYFLACLATRFQYVAGFTATPIITKAEQLTWLLYIIDSKKFQRTDKINNELKSGKRIDELYPLEIYNHDRESLGVANNYIPHVVEVEPHSFQLINNGGVIFQTTRKYGSYNQTSATIEILLENKIKGKKGLVYVHYVESREFLVAEMKKTRLKFAEIHGGTTEINSQEAQKKFNNDALDVLVISVREAINLDCSYFFFYEITAYFAQALGRSTRNYLPKIIDVYYLFTKHTTEKEYFAKTVLPVSALVREIIGREYKRFLPDYSSLFSTNDGEL